MSENLERDHAPAWASRWLVAAGVYNIAWGALTIAFPDLLFDIAEIERINHPEIWQCVGMIVGVYGVGYLLAASDPRRHWPIVLVGLIGKILGPVGFLHALARGSLPPLFGVTLITNDLIWWVPFTRILKDAARHWRADRRPPPSHCSHFVKESRIKAPPGLVFQFHESPDALERLIPPWEPVEVAVPPGSLETGSEVVLRIHFGPLSIHWVAIHTEYDPPHHFADRQDSGPFAWWYHRHRFLDDGEGGTLMRDEVEYQLPFWPLGNWAVGWLVSRKLERMFAYRHDRTREWVESKHHATGGTSAPRA